VISVQSWRTRAQGYTLIELIIVILIIGLITTVMLFRMGTVRFERKVSVLADQLHSFVQICQTQATLQPAVIGIFFKADSYQAYYFADGKPPQWLPLAEHDNFWQARPVPNDVFLHVSTTTPIIPGLVTPQVIIQSNGEFSPFTIDIGYVAESAHYRLAGTDAGELSLQVLK